MDELSALRKATNIVGIADQNDFERDLMHKADKDQREQEDALDDRRISKAQEKTDSLTNQIRQIEADVEKCVVPRERSTLLAKIDRLKNQRDNLAEEIQQIKQRKRQRDEEFGRSEPAFRSADDTTLIPANLSSSVPLKIEPGTSDESDEDLLADANDGLDDDGQEAIYEMRLIKWASRKRLKRVGTRSELSLDEAKREILKPMYPGKDVDIGNGFICPYEIYQRLFPYQRTALLWLWQLYQERVGGILGDEMGLGKTIQLISFLAGLHYSRKLRGPILVVCPATVLRQWVQEFHRWWPPFRVVILHATGSGMSLEADIKEETELGDSEWTSRADALMSQLVRKVCEKGHVIVTTYGAIRCHKDKLLSVRWGFCVLDEGHKIRNPDADVTVCCKMIKTAHRVILSGTPIQNNLRELWSLFDFVYPGRLGTLPIFQSEFALPIQFGGYANATHMQVQAAYQCAVVLRDLINPYLLRRLKVDVAQDLPEKKEQVLFVQLSPFQRAVYREFLDSRDCAAILAGKRHVLYGIDLLRKICNHPDLLVHHRDPVNKRRDKLAKHSLKRESQKSYLDRMRKRRHESLESSSSSIEALDDSDGDLPESDEAATVFHSRMLSALHFDDADFGSPERSGKLKVVQSLLELWWVQQRDEKHKVLLFCQTRQAKAILSKMLRVMELPFLEMDGTTPVQSRMELVQRFNSAPSEQVFLFLLTTKVGGLGINLTAADRVIIFDPDWNPSTDIQARERAWRLGQKRKVVIYRLLTAGTIEEKILHRQIFKTYLASRILKDPKQKRFFKSSELYELFTLSEQQEGTETGDLFSGLEAEIPIESSAKDGSGGAAGDDERALEWIGVQSVLQHDVIVDTKGESFEQIIVEKEASKIAKQAMEAVRASRQQLVSSQSSRHLGDLGVVTWTGRVGDISVHNGGGQSRKKVFGAKLNQDLVQQSLQLKPPTLVKVEAPSPARSSEKIDEKQLANLIISFFLDNGRQARTSEVMQSLSARIDVNDPVMVLAFRKILKTVAKFDKGTSDTGAGLWKLYDEF